MKRFFTAVLAALTLLSTAACGSAPAPVPSSGSSSAASSAQEPALSPEERYRQEQEALAQQREQRLQDLLDSMTLEEKVGQLFFVRCPADHAVEDLQTYHLGGYLLFGRDFKNGDSWLNWQQLTEKLRDYQAAAEIPLFIGSDEEGGSVTRVSRDPHLFSQPFSAPQTLYQNGGMDAVIQDVRNKSLALTQLGINVNLAPVCDVAEDPGSFLYDRTLGQDAQTTADYVSRTVQTMNGCGLLSVLKHFPGYGDNADTHTGSAVDSRPMERFESVDFLPFQAGIDADAPFVLVSHNIVQCMDPDLPASLSSEVHRILRQQLSFSGVILTDDLAMDAVSAYAGNGSVAVMALQAGNDMVVTTDYRTQIPAVIDAVNRGDLTEEVINEACLRVLRCKERYALLKLDLTTSLLRP